MTIPMPALNSRQRCAINRSGLMAPFLSYVQALRMEKLFAGLTESAAAAAGGGGSLSVPFAVVNSGLRRLLLFTGELAESAYLSGQSIKHLR